MKKPYSDRRFLQLNEIFMEEDIEVVEKSRKGIFLLDSQSSQILFFWNLLICAVFVVDIFCTPLILVWPDMK